MLNFVDRFLDKITMYRLLHDGLLILIGIAVVLGFFGILPYSAPSIIFSTAILWIISWFTNKLFSYVFEAPAASSSYGITAFILALIITPRLDIHSIPFYYWAAVLAMSSKYILAIKKKHIFNPAAIAVALTAFWLGQSASWWVGTTAMMPFVLVLGLLIVRKIQREDMMFGFFVVAVSTTLVFSFMKGTDIFTTLRTLLFQSSLLFFGFVMLTEPLTSPPTKKLQMMYGALVGFLFSPQVHIGTLYLTPELALLVGNVFSYLVSPKQKLLLRLQDKIQVGLDEIDFIFTPSEKMYFRPGQYMEWTLPHDKVDSRGNRRYFTLASSPTEDTIQLGIKFYPNGSSFKKNLAQFSPNHIMTAGQLAGDFTMPADKNKKLVFVAGGIGITPFRSMLKYLVDTKEKRDIVLLYSNKVATEIMYTDVFAAAFKEMGIPTIYTLTDETKVPSNWQGKVGRISEALIQESIPDWKERTFYLSGPHAMVSGFEQTLKVMGLPGGQIKKDFFPGFV